MTKMTKTQYTQISELIDITVDTIWNYEDEFEKELNRNTLHLHLLNIWCDGSVFVADPDDFFQLQYLGARYLQLVDLTAPDNFEGAYVWF